MRNLKQLRKLLGFFCLFFQFMTDSVCGIELKNGCNEQRDDPFVIDVLEVGKVVKMEHVALAGKHQYGRHKEQYVTEQHDAAQAADGEVLALVALQHLHGREAQCPQGVQIGGDGPLQQVGTGTDDHQQGTDEEDGVLDFIQLSHSHSQWIGSGYHARRHSARKCPHRPAS